MPTKIKKNTLITKIILMKRFFKTFIFLNLKTMLRDIYIYIYIYLFIYLSHQLKDRSMHFGCNLLI
jgi:hypothetical protein